MLDNIYIRMQQNAVPEVREALPLSDRAVNAYTTQIKVLQERLDQKEHEIKHLSNINRNDYFLFFIRQRKRTP